MHSGPVATTHNAAKRPGWTAVLFSALAIFAVNAWICHTLFAVEFTRNLQSNEAAFISIARFYRDHAGDLRWFPWFNGGMPIENAYQPVLPALSALVSWTTGWSIARAFHFFLALAYCFGPVALFWLAYDWAGDLLTASLAGLAASVLSPAPLLLPSLRAGSAGLWTPERLNNLIFYGEGPHVVALALFPLAILFLRRAILRRDAVSFAAAVVSCATVVLANAFGGVTLAVGALCVVLALRRGVVATLAVGVSAWLLASPWLPPALIETMRRNAWTERGYYSSGAATWACLALLLAIFATVFIWSKRLHSPLSRFAALFAPWMCAFPLASILAGVTLVPQAHRYQLEMEVSLCLAAACLAAHLSTRMTPALRWTAAVLLLFLFTQSARRDRNFAHELLRPIDITQTVEYKLTKWIDRNLPGRRVMVSGDAAYIFNVFSDNPQLSGGHEPTAPNFLQQIAVYQIYTGDHAGEQAAAVSLLWLKAFGVDAITVPGDATSEFYKPFVHPAGFDGLLPVLWREDGDTVYAVPRPRQSLAHVIPRAAAVTRAPIHGLDLGQLQTYVGALDDVSLPAASLEWTGPSVGKLTADVAASQVVSVQVAWDPAWHAVAAGKDVAVTRDGLGQILLDPLCSGPCEIRLTYGTTPANWLCRFASGFVIVGLAGLLLTRRKRPVLP